MSHYSFSAVFFLLRLIQVCQTGVVHVTLICHNLISFGVFESDGQTKKNILEAGFLRDLSDFSSPTSREGSIRVAIDAFGGQ